MKNVRLTKLGGKSALLITSLLLTPFYGYSEKSNVIPEKNEKAGNTRIKGTKHKTFRLRREKRRKQQN